MRTFVSLLVAMMLLVPSGFGAIVWPVESCGTLAGEAEGSCCCAPEEPVEDEGPSLQRGCCCEVKVPPAPRHEPFLPRDLTEESPEFGCPSGPWAVKVDFDDRACQPLPLRFRGPPRAPPCPLYLQHQRFLI